MPSSAYKPPPFPSLGATPESVAVAGTVLTRRMNTSLRQAGGQNGARRIVTAATYIASTDTWVGGDTTAAGFTLTLPSASDYSSMVVDLELYKGANALTIAARGTDTIDGAATVTVTARKTFRSINNSVWHIS